MRKSWIFFSLCLIPFYAFTNEEQSIESNYLNTIPFDVSMGRWAGYDHQRGDWQFFKQAYEDYQTHFKLAKNCIIPKLIHLIWLGGPLPERYKQTVDSWSKFHPTWEVKVWTDEDAKNYPFINQEAFDLAKNYGEKSDIWRYELLYKYGGLYVDTDFECLKPFDDLHKSCEFYTGISQGINPDLWIGILGSIPGHPILKLAVENIRSGSGDHDSERIMNVTGPYYFSKMFTTAYPLCALGSVVAFPVSFFYPFPAVERQRKDLDNMKEEFVKPESLAIHYFFCSWQR